MRYAVGAKDHGPAPKDWAVVLRPYHNSIRCGALRIDALRTHHRFAPLTTDNRSVKGLPGAPAPFALPYGVMTSVC